jgi:hypothetical protein
MAAAQDQAPDMRGRWKVEALSIVTGSGGHHPTTAPPLVQDDKPRLYNNFSATLQIDGQDGSRFWGTLESSAYKEPMIGTFTGEGGGFLMVDSDGFYQGDVLAPGRIRYCYQQNNLALKVAACGAITRE